MEHPLILLHLKRKKFCKKFHENWLIFRGCYWLSNIYMVGLYIHMGI